MGGLRRHDMKEKGICVWLTGLPSSGKSTIARTLAQMLLDQGYAVKVLDGDELRKTVSQGFGFSRSDREAHLRRVADMASECVQSGKIAICATVSPYRAIREECRSRLDGRFVEVFVATPLAVCEQRDPKGLYARARLGEILQFTGVSDPYEPPFHPELMLDTIGQNPEENAGEILEFLTQKAFLTPARIV
jgi:sulfate adenylyltransferase